MTRWSPYLATTDRYERTMHGWVDAPAEDTFTITVRLADPGVGVELVLVTTPSPEYGIRRATGRVLVDHEGRVDPTLAPGLGALAGLAMTGGFTGRASGVTGDRAGAAYFVDAAIEAARLARQVTRLPAEVVARHAAEGPVGMWRLDNLGWVDIPVSCYTYRPESEALFASRSVRSPMTPALYRPAPGARGVFNRTKVARLEHVAPAGLRLAHSMFDEAHAFQVWLALDDEAPGGPTVVDAGVLTPRLPYMGICSDPQAKIRDLVGERADAGLRKRLQTRLGGTGGCAQLYDLTADLLKLLTLPAPPAP